MFVPILVMLFVMGLYPQPFLSRMEPSVQAYVSRMQQKMAAGEPRRSVSYRAGATARLAPAGAGEADGAGQELRLTADDCLHDSRTRHILARHSAVADHHRHRDRGDGRRPVGRRSGPRRARLDRARRAGGDRDCGDRVVEHARQPASPVPSSSTATGSSSRCCSASPRG